MYFSDYQEHFCQGSILLFFFISFSFLLKARIRYVGPKISDENRIFNFMIKRMN